MFEHFDGQSQGKLIDLYDYVRAQNVTDPKAWALFGKFYMHYHAVGLLHQGRRQRV